LRARRPWAMQLRPRANRPDRGDTLLAGCLQESPGRMRALSGRWWAMMVALAMFPASAAASPAAPAPDPDWYHYRLAAGAGFGMGDAGWGTELGTLTEALVRLQPERWWGVGLSFFQINAPNNESYSPLTVKALELSASLHPLPNTWFDPFVRIGGLRVLGASAGYPGEAATVGRWGLDAVAGLSVTPGPFALGLDLRHGFTSRGWTMLGVHVELRLPLR
jgi:hypothetical protein